MRKGIARSNLGGATLVMVFVICLLPGELSAQVPKIILPTENHALLEGDIAAFYQYVKRDFEGAVSEPWEGGKYGLVRNPRKVGGTIIYTRFHEGIDIRPVLKPAARSSTQIW
jgi:hypothetical protein